MLRTGFVEESTPERLIVAPRSPLTRKATPLPLPARVESPNKIVCAGHGSKFMATHDEFEQANQRAKDLQARVPRAVSAHYDHKTGRIVIHLSSKLIVSFLPGDVEGLEDARPSQLSKIEISPSGFGVHFPAVDADLYVPGLLEGFLGSKTWMAS